MIRDMTPEEKTAGGPSEVGRGAATPAPSLLRGRMPTNGRLVPSTPARKGSMCSMWRRSMTQQCDLCNGAGLYPYCQACGALQRPSGHDPWWLRGNFFLTPTDMDGMTTKMDQQQPMRCTMQDGSVEIHDFRLHGDQWLPIKSMNPLHRARRVESMSGDLVVKDAYGIIGQAVSLKAALAEETRNRHDAMVLKVHDGIAASYGMGGPHRRYLAGNTRTGSVTLQAKNTEAFRSELQRLAEETRKLAPKIEMTEQQRVAMETLRGDWDEWAEIHGDHGEVRFAPVELSCYPLYNPNDTAIQEATSYEDYPPVEHGLRGGLVGVGLSAYPTDDEDVIKFGEQHSAAVDKVNKYIGLPISKLHIRVDIDTEPSTNVDLFTE